METIMIQEADEATLEVVTTALEMEGYRVYRLTANKENALELIRRNRPKLILLDCWLSNYSGRQTGQWIKAHFPELPVVAFTCDNRIEETYREFGFDDYIKKPFDLDLLYRVVARRRRPRLHNSTSIST